MAIRSGLLIKKSLLILGVSCAMAVNVNAQPVPAKNEFKMVVQPSGQHITLNILGDEHFSWLETRKGLVVVHNKQTGSYDYAVVKEVDSMLTLQSSGIAATENDEGIREGFVPLKRKDVVAIRKRKKMKEYAN